MTPTEPLPGKWRWELQSGGWTAVWRAGKKVMMLRPKPGESFREAVIRNGVSDAAWLSWGGTL